MGRPPLAWVKAASPGHGFGCAGLDPGLGVGGLDGNALAQQGQLGHGDSDDLVAAPGAAGGAGPACQQGVQIKGYADLIEEGICGGNNRAGYGGKPFASSQRRRSRRMGGPAGVGKARSGHVSRR